MSRQSRWVFLVPRRSTDLPESPIRNAMPTDEACLRDPPQEPPPDIRLRAIARSRMDDINTLRGIRSRPSLAEPPHRCRCGYSGRRVNVDFGITTQADHGLRHNHGYANGRDQGCVEATGCGDRTHAGAAPCHSYRTRCLAPMTGHGQRPIRLRWVFPRGTRNKHGSGWSTPMGRLRFRQPPQLALPYRVPGLAAPVLLDPLLPALLHTE